MSRQQQKNLGNKVFASSKVRSSLGEFQALSLSLPLFLLKHVGFFGHQYLNIQKEMIIFK